MSGRLPGKPRVRIVGVGPGSKQYLTKAGEDAIRSSTAVLGWELDLHPAKQLLHDKIVYTQTVDNFKEVAKQAARETLRKGLDIAILRIGDPCVSSGLAGLIDTFSDFQIEVIPGISSVQIAAALSRISIDDSAIVSFHEYGDPEAKKKFMLGAFRAGRHLIILPSPDMRPKDAARHLIESGAPRSVEAYVYSNLTLPDESNFRGPLKDIVGKDFHWLSIAVFPNPSITSAEEAEKIWEKWRASH